MRIVWKTIIDFWLASLDVVTIWVQPVLVGVSVLASAFLTYDFSHVYSYVPSWKHQIDLLRSALPITLVLTQVFLLAVSIFQGIRQCSIRKLKKQVDEYREKINIIASNVETLVDGILLRLAEKLKLDKGDPSRLTIYIHNSNGHFISFGRYSPDPSLNEKGRSLLPDNAGCISQAWKSDWCYEGNLSSKDCRQKYKVEQSVVDGLRMKSRFYAVKRIDSSNKRPLAVVVFESVTANKFDEQKIRNLLNGEEAYLAEIIDCLKEHIPNPQDAQKWGF